MKNYELRGTTAYYDSLVNQTPLLSSSQAHKWYEELRKKHGVETLYIKTINNKFYCQTAGNEITAVAQEDFEKTWNNCEQPNSVQQKAVPPSKEIEQVADDRENIKRVISEEIENIIAKIRLKLEK